MENKRKQKFSDSSEMKRQDCSEEKFVWPWVGLVANIPTEIGQNGQRVGKSGSTLRNELTHKGFNPTRVQPIWNFKGHSGFALVEFNKDFQGFENAMRFERSYKSISHGKRDWEKGVHLRDEKLYGWIAREDDYNGSGIVCKNVKKKRDLKTLSQIQAEEERKMNLLVANMSQSIEIKKISKQKLEEKVDEISSCLEDLELHNHHLNRIFREEVEKMHMNVQELYQQTMLGLENSMSEIEIKRKKLEERARQIEHRANITEDEIKTSILEREMITKAMLEQSEVNAEAMMLAEKHQREKEKLHEKIMEMEAKLNERQEIELEIEKLKGTTNVMKHMMGTDGDPEFLEKIAKTQIELDAREMDLQDKMMTLATKERETNDEYQDARKEMIRFCNLNQDLMSEEKIRVKRMGQLNPKVFLAAVKKKQRGSNARAEVKAMELCSLWEGNIGDVQWHPFKVDESDGTPKRVVDKYDGKLVLLKYEYGEEVVNEVVRAKQEMEDNNASGSYVILELWNYGENRKATMEEATDVMMKIWLGLSANKKKRKRF